LVSIASSITPVPGTINVRLLSDNQVANATYRPSATVHYSVEFENVPIEADVHIGVEVRGSNPEGGPRGYISHARPSTPITEFIKETNNIGQFKLIPADVFAGYHWFIRPYVFFANESMVSTNMMNAGYSPMFTVLKQ